MSNQIQSMQNYLSVRHPMYALLLYHKQLVRSIPRLSVPYCHLSTGQNQCYGNVLLYETSMFIVKMADHDGNHRCLVEKNVPIALILPSRWQYDAENLGMETPSCL